MVTPEIIRIERPFYFFVTNRCHESDRRTTRGSGCAIANVPVFAGRVTDPAKWENKTFE